MSFYKVVIDTKGSDKGAVMVAEGVALALEKFPDLFAVLSGDEEYLRAEMEKHGADASRIEYINAPDEITNYDNPGMAIFTKRDSSLVKALEALAANDEYLGLVNAGSTGALLAGSLRYLATPDMQRPALCAVLPAENGAFTALVDTGATVDCSAAQLQHFAHLGRDHMRALYGIESPKIGLLSNGKEEGKGNKVVKEAKTMRDIYGLDDEGLETIKYSKGRIDASEELVMGKIMDAAFAEDEDAKPAKKGGKK